MDGIQQAPRMAGSSEGCDRNSASEKIHFSEGRLIQRSKPRSKPKKQKKEPVSYKKLALAYPPFQRTETPKIGEYSPGRRGGRIKASE